MTPELLMLLFLFLGIALGGICAWMIAQYKFGQEGLTADELKKQYIHQSAYQTLQTQAETQQKDLANKEDEIRDLMQALAAREEKMLAYEDKLTNQRQEIQELHQQSQLQFEQIANRLLEEKSEKFSIQNAHQLSNILNPLRERITEFESDIEKKFWEETKDRISLKKEIEHLRSLNQQLSQDANNLVNALKGDNKIQGDWGEIRLEMLLERAGLTKDIHYTTQTSFKDQYGNDKRPDFIINLPEDKHLIIDSKVSLAAYERYFNAKDELAKAKHLKDHLESIKLHIRNLHSKKYEHLYQINTPDYLLLFVPIEPAFTLATQSEQNLFLEALDKNIVLVTTSTLLATMRTVSFIWKQEKQKNNVLEIARQSGFLYDKFCAFVEDIQTIGQRLDHAQTAYHGAMNKLVESKKYGDTLIGRAQRIKELGAKTSKELPTEVVKRIKD